MIYTNFSLSNRYTSRILSDSSKPDIYFLVYDEYTNNETLQQLWRYDNSEITNWLLEKGFFIPPNTKSNYNYTPFSISSTLNMDYLDSNKGNTPLFTLQAIKSISYNQTFSILKKEAYHLRLLTPFESDIEDIKTVHEFGDFPSKHLYNTIFLYRIQRDILWNFPKNEITYTIANFFSYEDYTDLEKRITNINNTIKKVKSEVTTNAGQPKFVYAHLMITHSPHLFDANGNVLKKTVTDSLEFFNSYPNQVRYANKTIEELVEFINTNNTRKAIIIIMGDHGFRRLPTTMVRYNFPNFFAINFPDKDYSLLYDSITPVNIFRVVFNSYFHQNFPLLKDSCVTIKYQ